MKIKQLFDDLFKTVKFDKKLAREIYKYQFSYLVTDPDRAEFFGGALIGVVNVYFTDAFVNKFFNKIIMLDQHKIKSSLHLAPSINEEYLVTGDPLNLVLFYMVHRFLSNTKMKRKDRERVAFDLILIFNYRTIAALHSNGFKWLGNKELSVSSYEAMSNKFILKQVGNWMKYMEYRAKSILDPKLTNLDPLTTMATDKEFLDVIADAQNRIRSTFKLMYRQREAHRAAGVGVHITKMVKEYSDGETEVSEKLGGIDSIIGNTVQTLMIKPDLLDPRMMALVASVLSGVSAHNVYQILEGVHKAIRGKNGPKVIAFYRSTLAFMYEQIRSSTSTSSKTTQGELILFIKGVVNSSRSVDPTLFKIREEGMEVVDMSTDKKDTQIRTRYRLVILMHMFILSMTK